MASLEYRIPKSGFQDKITYLNPEIRPETVVNFTSNAFNLFFSGRKDEFEGVRSYLKHTLEFIDNARAGLAHFPHVVDRLSLANYADREIIETIDRNPTVPIDEEQEALRFSLMTMGAMPQLASVDFTDLENNTNTLSFSKRGLLSPPETLTEVAGRLRELWVETLGIASKNRSINDHIFQNEHTLRTRLYFDVGKEIAVA